MMPRRMVCGGLVMVLGLGIVAGLIVGADREPKRKRPLAARLDELEKRIAALESGQTAVQGEVTGVLAAERFLVIDRKDRTRAVFEALDNGAVAIGMFAADGKGCLELSVTESGGATIHVGQGGGPNMILGAAPGLPAELTVTDGNKARLQLRVTKDEPRVTLAGKDGVRRLELRASDNDCALDLCDRRGEACLQLFNAGRGETGSQAGIMGLDDNYSPRFSLIRQADGSAHLHFARRNKEVFYAVP